MKRVLYILMGVALFAGAQFGWQHLPVAMAQSAQTSEAVFVGEIRGVAERARALMSEIDAYSDIWYLGMDVKVGIGAAEIDSKRTTVPFNATGQNTTNLMANLFAIRAAANDQIIAQLCVRPPGNN